MRAQMRAHQSLIVRLFTEKGDFGNRDRPCSRLSMGDFDLHCSYRDLASTIGAAHNWLKKVASYTSSATSLTYLMLRSREREAQH
jgi:hypothetical protein